MVKNRSILPWSNAPWSNAPWSNACPLSVFSRARKPDLLVRRDQLFRTSALPNINAMCACPSRRCAYRVYGSSIAWVSNVPVNAELTVAAPKFLIPAPWGVSRSALTR